MRALVIQEAVRAGVPVVATAVGGVPELTGDAALLVPAGDARAVAAAVGRVVAEPDLVARLVRGATTQSPGWPGKDDTARQVAAVYAGLTAR